MASRTCRALLAAAGLAAACGASAADSMRCEGGIVGLGDLVVDLIGKCGSPALRERWTESRDAMAVDVARGVAASERLTTEVEQWTYDFGRNRFLQLVTLWNGRIVRFEQGGYGHGLPPALELPRPRVTRCDVSLIRQGDTKVDALGRCGPPTSAVSWEAPRTRPVVVESGSETWGVPGGTAHVELWVYNLGPNQFIRIVRFEDGRVTSVETGGYGYPD